MSQGQNQLAEKKPEKLRMQLAKPEVVEGIASALNGCIDADAFISQIVIHFSSKPEIAQCTPESQFTAAHQCAALGLLPNLQQVAIIPRQVKDKQIWLATVMPQWQGYKALMMRNGDVEDITVRLVHVTDSYDYDGDTDVFIHHFDPFNANRKVEKIEDIKGGYVRVKWKDRTRPDTIHFVTADTIARARACAGTSDVWGRWFQEQCLKTCLRNAYARRVVAVDPLFANRLELLGQAEDLALQNDPMRGVVQQQATRIAGPSKVDRIAARFAPPVVEANFVEGDVVTDCPAEPEKPKASGNPPPDVPAHLTAVATAIHQAKDADEVKAIIDVQVVKSRTSTPDDVDAAVALGDWKIATLKKKGAKA